MFFGSDRSVKRTLGIRDKQILYRNANKRCENPACGKKIDFDEMQVGHMTAYSRGGSTTLKNSKCLCYRCNKLQGTDRWATFLKKQNIEDPKTAMKKSMKQSLEALNIQQLKLLADNHSVKVLGRIEQGLFESRRLPPTKSQYVSKLSGVLTAAELRSMPKKTPIKAKTIRKKRGPSDPFGLGW